jgi:hypothetical protein
MSNLSDVHLSLSFVREDMGEGALDCEGPAAVCLATIIQAHERSPNGLTLQWQIGSGWSELFIHPGEDVADALESARHEIMGTYGPPAILTEEEEAIALHVLNSLLRHV